MKLLFIILFISSFANAKQTIYEDLRVEGTASANRIESTVSSNPCPSYSQASIDALSGSVAGDCVFNTTTQNLNVFDGTIWKSAGGGLSMWEEGKVFNLDDVVVYDNAIYKCTEAHTSISTFELAKWSLISADTLIKSGDEVVHTKKIEADKIVRTDSETIKIETDHGNAFVNGDFEAMTVGQGWSKSTGAGWFSSTDAFSGKKSIEIQFGNTVANVWQLVSRPQWKGRKVRLTANYKLATDLWTTNIPELCVANGTTSNLTQCVPVKSTGTEWALYEAEFIWFEDSHGLFIKNNTLVDLTNRLKVDNIRIYVSPNEAIEAMIEGQYQSENLLNVGSLNASSDLSVFTSVNTSSNAVIYTKSPQGITLLRDAYVSVNYYVCGDGVQKFMQSRIFLDAAEKSGNLGEGTYGAASTFSGYVKKNQRITFAGAGSGAVCSNISIKATARSPMVIYPEESFDSSINNLKWASSAEYTEATLPNAPIGTYITYKSTGGTVTQTGAGERPTQTDEQMKTQGVLVNGTAYSSNSPSTTPSKLILNIGKNLGEPLIEAFKDLSRTAVASVTGVGFYGGASDDRQTGWMVAYNSQTGLLTIDAKGVLAGNVFAPLLAFNDRSTQSTAYLRIKASKTGAGIQNKPARQIAYVSPPGSANDITLYDDGYCEQSVKSSSFNVAANYVANPSINLPVAMKDTSYLSVFDLYGSGASYFVYLEARAVSLKTTTAVSPTVRNQTSTVYTGGFVSALVKGYCAASALLPYGIKVNY